MRVKICCIGVLMIISAGELLVEFVSHELDCGLAKTTKFSGPFPSGAPAIFVNQAAKVGAKSKMIGGVGADPFGKLILDRLISDSVDVENVQCHPDHTTGAAFVSYYSDGSRKFVFHISNTASDRELTYEPLQPGCIFHVSGSSLGFSNLRESLMNLVEDAASVGAVSFDPNIRPETIADSKTRNCLDKILELCTYLLPSEADLDYLSPGSNCDDYIYKNLEIGKRAVVIKRGKFGAIGSDGGEIIKSSPLLVEEIDPTGAGDCFCGTFIGLIDQSASFELAINQATIAGGLHVTQRGPMDWNPTLEEIDLQITKERA